MDLAESSVNQKAFITGRGAEIFIKFRLPPILGEQYKDSAPPCEVVGN
jgi:hypothetical protein